MGNHNDLMFELLENLDNIEVNNSVICTEPLVLDKRTEVQWAFGNRTVFKNIIFPKLIVVESNGALVDSDDSQVTEVDCFLVITHLNEILKVYYLKDNTPENCRFLLKAIQE